MVATEAQISGSREIVDGIPRVEAALLDEESTSISPGLLEALERFSCCVIANAGVEHDAWRALLAAAQEVHGAPAAVRYGAWRGFHPSSRGYQPSEHVAGEVASECEVDAKLVGYARGRTFSSFDLGPPWPVGGGAATADVINAYQPWPALDGFTDDLPTLFARLHRVGGQIARYLIEACSPSGATIPGMDAPCSSLRLLRYDAIDTRAELYSEVHTDWEAVTLLIADEPGLQVQDREGVWREPKVSPDDVVLMAGDVLESVTRNRLPAAQHRVRILPRVRHSAVLFIGVDYDFILPMPSTGLSGPFGQHLEGMLVKTTPHLKARYDVGELAVPFDLPEPNPFKGEPTA